MSLLFELYQQAPTRSAEVLLLTSAFPPSAGGTPYLLHDILKYFPPNFFIVLCGPYVKGGVNSSALPFDREQFALLHMHGWSYRLMQRQRNALIPLLIRQGTALAKIYGVKRIYAHYPSSIFTVAAYEIAEKLNLPLTVYFDILWEERGENLKLARQYEHRVVERADQRFAISEFAVDFLSEKHGVPFALMPHTTNIDDLPDKLTPVAVPSQAPYRVHFAGSIYDRMNLDAVRRLAQVISRQDGRFTLELYSNTPRQALVAAGFPSEHWTHGFVSRSEIQTLQEQSHVLYLPQAFESDAPQMLRHNFPTKALEYMRARRPILVHSPEDTYLADLVHKHGSGLLVNEPDEVALEAALNRLVTEPDLVSKLVENAGRFLRSRDAKQWSATFYKSLAQH